MPSPKRWRRIGSHDRLPFFARVDQDGDVFFDGGTQATVDAEINLASGAGIDYWDFCRLPAPAAVCQSRYGSISPAR